MSDFDSVGYKYIPKLFDEATMRIVSQYFENKLFREEIKPDPRAAQTRNTVISYYADPLVEVLLKQAMDFISETIGHKLVPTYSFFRVYQPNEELSKHTDRPACEISVTVNVASLGEPNKIHMKAKGKESSAFALKPGDGVVYKGCEIEHWREPLNEGQLIVQFMLHYVREEGDYAHHIFDGRPKLGGASCR